VASVRFYSVLPEVLRERNKSTNDGFETMRKETTLRGENVKYISSSTLFWAPPLGTALHGFYTGGGTQTARDASKRLKKTYLTILVTRKITTVVKATGRQSK
jgi:hypothetical protein